MPGPLGAAPMIESILSNPIPLVRKDRVQLRRAVVLVSVLDLEVACSLAITQRQTPYAGTTGMQPMCFSLNDVNHP